MSKRSKVFAVVPAYNEEKRISKAIKDLKKYNYNLVVVDDSSVDNTVKVVKKFRNIILVEQKVNRGQGAALRVGIKRALKEGADIIVTFDGDGQHQAKEISDRAADLLLRELVLKPQNPKKLAEKLNLLNLTEDELSKLINIVLKKNKDSVDQYKKGKTKVLAFLIGQVIRESKGRADAKIVKELIMKKSFLY
mgnify:CR=1 FL=1